MRSILFTFTLAIELTAALGAASVRAANLQVLYPFCSLPHCTDGASPVSPVIRDANGNFYGTTYGGGTYYGTIYKLAPDGTESVLYTFQDNGDGGYIRDGVVMDKSGNLYGTSDFGGKANVGLVFKLAADGTESTLYSFAGGTDGAYTDAGLIIDPKGNLFGTTDYGGSSNCAPFGCGTVFKVAPGGKETVLYRFCETTPCNDGAVPLAGVIADRKGNLYGTTQGGGTYGYGTVFRIASDGTESVLHSFGASGDGQGPVAGLVKDAAGNLYGTTPFGGANFSGAVFKVAPDGTETVLHSFCGDCSDGDEPVTGLAIDAKGNLYGTTTGGGKKCPEQDSCGVIFKLAPDGTETLLWRGKADASSLMLDSTGELYGTTDERGPDGGGMVFAIRK